MPAAQAAEQYGEEEKSGESASADPDADAYAGDGFGGSDSGLSEGEAADPEIAAAFVQKERFQKTWKKSREHLQTLKKER